MPTTQSRNNRSTERANETSPLNEAQFSEGDLGKIQGILFGDQAKQTSERIDNMEIALLAAIAELKVNMNTKIDALWARLEDETETRSAAVTKLTTQAEAEASTRAKAHTQIQKDLTKTADRLSSTIDSVATTAAEQLQTTRKDLIGQIGDATSDLRDKSMSRESMVALLTASALQLSNEDS